MILVTASRSMKTSEKQHKQTTELSKDIRWCEVVRYWIPRCTSQAKNFVAAIKNAGVCEGV